MDLDLDDSTSVLRHLLASDDLDRAFERVFSPAPIPSESAAVQVVVPGEVLAAGIDLRAFLDSVSSEYDEIEAVLAGLKEVESAPEEGGDAVAFVSAEELADPQTLALAVAPLQSEAARLEQLFVQARSFLERLQVYRLSRSAPATLVAVLREEHNLRTLQYVIEFLRTLQRAADTFETLELPRPHIRDYLRHLYSMGDWQEMRQLVARLELAAGRMIGDGVG